MQDEPDKLKSLLEIINLNNIDKKGIIVSVKSRAIIE